MSGRGDRGRGRGRGGGRQPPATDAGRGPQASRGGGQGRGGGGGFNAPPPASLSTSAAPFQPSRAEAAASLPHEVEQKLSLGASSSAPTPSLQPQGPPPPANPPPEQSVLPPASTKAIRHPQRPGFGTAGRKVIVKANHFLAAVAERDLSHYDVTISPEVPSKKVCRDIINQLVATYKDSHLGKRKLAYDGRKSCYSAGSLPFESKDFVVTLLDKDRPERERKFTVSLKLASKPSLYHLQQFIQGRQLDLPQETLQLLDVVLRENPSKSYAVVGRSFFSPVLGDIGELGNGLMYWKGFYQSLRPTQMGLSLNIDISARAFLEPIEVLDYICKHFDKDLTRVRLSDQDRIKMKKALRGVRVETHHQGLRRHKISGISTQPANQLMLVIQLKKTICQELPSLWCKRGIILGYFQLIIEIGTQRIGVETFSPELWLIPKFAILLNSISIYVAMRGYRVPVAPHTTTFCMMRTTSLQMAFKRLRTICATRMLVARVRSRLFHQLTMRILPLFVLVTTLKGLTTLTVDPPLMVLEGLRGREAWRSDLCLQSKIM